MHKIFKSTELGLEVEVGKFARQADGATWIKAGNNIVLSTVVASKLAKDFAGFFPLTIEYRERLSAVGRIPGGYVKREGKLSDAEVLTSRLIDRPIRPLFPSYYFNEVQLLSTVYSSDGKFPAGVLAMIGSSLALALSPIPFMGPIGGVQACRINGEWKFNVSYDDSLLADAQITIAGTKHGISMVEGHCNNVSEGEMIDVLFMAHDVIKQQIAWQEGIQRELGIEKQPYTSSGGFDWDLWKSKIKASLPAGFSEGFFGEDKATRSVAMDALQDHVVSTFADAVKEEQISSSVLLYLFNSIIKEELPEAMARKNLRVDGRSFDQIRPIFTEVATLPCAHGSALFQRGETQALATITLGTGQDTQKIESMLAGTIERAFMLHYNMPPFATGEVKPMRGTGRREIGHGYLAETSFANVLPSQAEFPYTIRSLVDVLESNGSSSMATVCATTMALMDSGVPLKDMVSGIAMGLIKDSSGKFHVLTDILGTEDAFGLMDFKVTGTDKGIMAFQLDIKDPSGLTRDLLGIALEKAKIARLFILGKMRDVLATPRTQISDLAPRVSSFKIPQDKIGAIIGPSGKNIKEIIAKTGTQIDIDDKGTEGVVKIYSKNVKAAAEAEAWVKILAGQIDVGSVFTGIIRRYADFGIFVEIVSGKDGLVHVSSIAKSKQKDIEKRHPINSELVVKVVAYDPESGRIRLVAPELE